MMRRPLDLFFVSERPSIDARRFAIMGASVAQVRYDRTTATMKYGLRVADAVVIDATNNNALVSSQVIRATNLALETRQLPDYVAMPSGARWNGLPVAMLVDDEWTAYAIASDPSLRFVIPCVIQPSWNWYHEYVDPWPDIYQRIDDAAYWTTLQRLEEMQSIGHRFEVRHGRWIRTNTTFIEASLGESARN